MQREGPQLAGDRAWGQIRASVGIRSLRLPCATPKNLERGNKEGRCYRKSSLVRGRYSLKCPCGCSCWVALITGWQAGGFFGAIGGLVVAFIFGSMFMGALLVLDDIRETVKAIESNQGK